MLVVILSIIQAGVRSRCRLHIPAMPARRCHFTCSNDCACPQVSLRALAIAAPPSLCYHPTYDRRAIEENLHAYQI